VGHDIGPSALRHVLVHADRGAPRGRSRHITGKEDTVIVAHDTRALLERCYCFGRRTACDWCGGTGWVLSQAGRALIASLSPDEREYLGLAIIQRRNAALEPDGTWRLSNV
jgi:hypothetical protein